MWKPFAGQAVKGLIKGLRLRINTKEKSYVRLSTMLENLRLKFQIGDHMKIYKFCFALLLLTLLMAGCSGGVKDANNSNFKAAAQAFLNREYPY